MVSWILLFSLLPNQEKNLSSFVFLLIYSYKKIISLVIIYILGKLSALHPVINYLNKLIDDHIDFIFKWVH